MTRASLARSLPLLINICLTGEGGLSLAMISEKGFVASIIPKTKIMSFSVQGRLKRGLEAGRQAGYIKRSP